MVGGGGVKSNFHVKLNSLGALAHAPWSTSYLNKVSSAQSFLNIPQVEVGLLRSKESNK